MNDTNDKASHSALLVRYRQWFRPFFDISNLPIFEPSAIDSVALGPANVFRTRVLVGRGPFQHSIFAIPQLWFGQGDSSYPTFTAPNSGPAGAGLFATPKSSKVEASDSEGICVVETSIIYPVAEDFLANHEQERRDVGLTPPSDIVSRLLSDSKKWVEQTVGLYALSQYPLIWEPLATEQMSHHIDLAKCKSRDITSQNLDFQIPFRLDPSSMIKGHHLDDGVLKNLPQLQNTDLHLPLLLLQRTLWQKNAQVRFLEAFWLLDFLASQHKAADPERGERERMYSLMQEFFEKNHPEFNTRIQSLKHVVLQASQRNRMEAYFKHLGIAWNQEAIRRMTALRNALAHARSADATELALVGGELILLARAVMKLELEARGFSFSADGQNL